jgi:hypothetical protein
VRLPIRVVLALLPVACLPAPVTPNSPPAAIESGETESLIDMAQGAPGEFAADALLRIAALDQLPPARRVRLLEEAFSRAAEAQQAFKRRNAMQSVSSNAGFLERAYGQELDALSLRARAVQAMLPLDPGKARKLFSDIPPVELPLVPCGDFLVFDVDRYYDALAAVTQRAFTPKEVHDGAQYQFLLQRIATIASPAQISPAVRAILASGLRDADFPGAVAAFTAALRKIAGDDRSFTDYLPAADDRVLALSEECQRRRISPLPLLEAYRIYLVFNFSAARCADDDQSSGSTSSQMLDARSAEAVRFFNQSIRMAPLQPIQNSETAPSARLGTASGLRSCESAECQALARQHRSLVFNATGSALPSAARDTAEWKEQLAQFLTSLADWQENTGSGAAQQFREKCALYGDLIGLLPDGPSRDLALRAMLEYLQHSRTQELSRIEWLLPVNALIGRIGLDPFSSSHVAEDLRRSTDAVIALYAQLERVAPRSAADILPLL